MILSRSSRYILQALVILAAEPADAPLMVRELAVRLHLPAAYLSKLLQKLVRAGVLQSCRGPQGGFRLTSLGRSMSIMQLIVLINGEESVQECILGFKICADDSACALHCHWRPVKEQLFDLLANQSIGDLARAVASGGWRLDELNAFAPPTVRSPSMARAPQRVAATWRDSK